MDQAKVGTRAKVSVVDTFLDEIWMRNLAQTKRKKVRMFSDIFVWVSSLSQDSKALLTLKR